MSTGHLLSQAHCFLFCLLSLVSFSACSHIVQDDVQPSVIAEPSYTINSHQALEKLPTKWWQVFNDPLLDAHIEQALANNFTLQEGFARLKQARSIQNQAGSQFYPTLDGRVRAESEWEAENTRTDSNRIELDLSWEVDLWGRLSSVAQATSFETFAAEDELQGLALLLSVEVADTYFQLVVQYLHQQLLQRQIEANTTSLNVIRLRFANGLVSLVDVYQQKQLLAAVKAELPLSEARNIILQNRLHVLLGQPPESTPLAFRQTFPEIPALPMLGIPADLLQNRPDLRQLQRELVAADYRVAEAVADRLPALKIGGSAAFISGDFITALFADALATIVDWGGKKSEVEKKKAMVEEKTARYSQRYLVAIEEVENSLWQERKHEQLLTALTEQLLISKATLRESRSRYVQGMTDYIPVLTALVSFQKLEMNILQRKQERISYRLLLYRALGTDVLGTERDALLIDN